MIKTLSPYYINVPWVNPSTTEIADSVLIRVYVWNGYKGSVPTTATYEAIKENPTASNETVKINIANWINDFITLDTNTDITTGSHNGNNQRWVKWEVYYSIDETNYEEFSQIQGVELFSKGYSYGMDGENVNINTGFLIPISDYKVATNSFVTIPYLISEGLPADAPVMTLNSVTYNSGETYDYDFNIINSSGNLVFYHRQNGSTQWIENRLGLDYSDGNYIITSGDIDLTGSVDFAVGLFYPVTSEFVYSNIITLTI